MPSEAEVVAQQIVAAVTPQIQALTFMNTILMIVIGFLAFLLILCFLFTPSQVFLMCKFRGKNVAGIARKDGKMHFVPSWIEGSLLKTKKYGEYIIGEGSDFINEMKSGCRIFFCDPRIGITQSMKYHQALEKLHELGIETIEEAKVVASSWVRCQECQKESMFDTEKIGHDEKENKDILKAVCHFCKSDKIVKAEFEIPIEPKKVIKFADFEKFYMKNMNAHALENTIRYDVNNEMEHQRNPNRGLLMFFAGIGILVFLSCLGMYILMYGPHPAATETATTAAQYVANATMNASVIPG